MKNSVVLSGRVGRFEKVETSNSTYYKLSIAQSVDAFDANGRRLPSQTEWFNLLAFDNAEMDNIGKGDAVEVRGSLGNYRRAGEQYSQLTVRVNKVKLIEAATKVEKEEVVEEEEETPFS